MTPDETPSSTPNPKVSKMVAATAAKSTFEYCQLDFNIEKSTKLRTATMIVAAKVALGKKNNSGVKNSAASSIPTAVKAPAAGVSAPASKLTTDRANPPGRP